MLHCIEAPDLPDQKIKFTKGEEMGIAAGATACRLPVHVGSVPDDTKSLTCTVISGAKNFDLLSSDEQEFALNTTVQYAPRAYEFIRHCKATDDGFSIAEVGEEMREANLTPFDWAKVHAFPVSKANSPMM